MEQERALREHEEEEKKKKAAKIKEEFGDTDTQWTKDQQDMQNLEAQQKPKVKPADLPGGSKAGKDGQDAAGAGKAGGDRDVAAKRAEKLAGAKGQ